MGLAADIGLRGVMLGVERIEVLLKPVVGRYPGVDRAANRLDRQQFLTVSKLTFNGNPMRRLRKFRIGSRT
jgi:hypothetical protein